METMKSTKKRFRATKKQVHLAVGWRYLIWDTRGSDFVLSQLYPGRVLSYESKEAAEKQASELNAKRRP